MKKNIFRLLAVLAITYSCSGHKEDKRNITPKPSIFRLTDEGSFEITRKTRIIYQPNTPELAELADSLSVFLSKASGFNIESVAFSTDGSLNNYILLSTFQADSVYGKEGYKLRIGQDGILIHANTGAGIFYGIQSLRQLLPIEVFSGKAESISVKSAYISDKPRFAYRGMHLDVSRHFFPVSFIKKYIDLLSFYKMNTFHWHLTDDNGWRIEIRKYPDLTEKSAWHVDRNDQPWNEVTPPRPDEKATIGGYYTQDEIREIVRYAASRYVTIIPEIEMPGHSCEVFAAYPDLSCKGDTLPVQPGTYWPNIDILCAGNDDVFTFIDDVLTEVADLFPGPYIHIGGDEADKTRWSACKKCQKRISEEKLRNEAELQSWFIKRVEKIVTAKGKKMIGWDEILEGGLAPEATVMSWRGMEGGIEAARMGHDVIMTPTSYCYFDYYQAEPENEPTAIGGFLTLKKVYSFEPLPPVLNEMESKYIIGAQGNLWTEFIPTPEHAEYMALPRMIALAEVNWSKKENRDYSDFIRRMNHQFAILDQMKVNYGKQSTHIDISLSRHEKTGKLMINMDTELFKPEVKYTTDGNEPSIESNTYTVPFEIGSSCTIKAAIFKDGKQVGKISERTFTIHSATGLKCEISPPPSFKYQARGAQSLTDATLGSLNHNDGCWLGFEGDDAEIKLDLGNEQPVREIQVAFLQNIKSWIMLPQSVLLEVADISGTYIKEGEITIGISSPADTIIRKNIVFQVKKKNCRFIRIKIKNGGPLPADHLYPGEPAWLFIDELVVN